MNEETLSSFWRKRRSTDRPIALRDLQNELTYLARLILNDDAVNVGWHEKLIDQQGQRYGRTIILDSSPVEDLDQNQPVPDERVDVLVGDTTYRAHLELLKKDAAYGAASNALASYDSQPYYMKYRMQDRKDIHGDIYRLSKEHDLQRVVTALQHLKAYYKCYDTQSPAVKEYAQKSRDWKRERIGEIAAQLKEACSDPDASQIAFEDVLDLWALWLVYDIPLDGELSRDVIDSMLTASRKAYALVNRDKETHVDVLRAIRDITADFSRFSNRADIQPPASESGESDEDDGQGEDEDGEGQSSPEGTEKENEGEPPEGGPGEDDEELPDNQEPNEDSDSERDGNSDGDDDNREDRDRESGDSSEVSDNESEDENSSDGDDSDETDMEGPQESDGHERDSSDDQDEDEDNEDSEEETDSSESPDESSNDDTEDSDDSGEDSGSESQQPVDIRPAVDRADQISSLDDATADEIRESIEFAREDITEEVFGAGASNQTIIWEKAPYDRILEAKLRTDAYSNATGITQILQRFKRLRSRVEHGATEGYRPDYRRVGRITYGNEHVFQKRAIIDKLNMALVLLLDSSSSVHDDQWDVIMKVTASFVQAFSGRDDVELIAESYTTGDYASGNPGGVMMVRHFDKRLNRFNATRPYSSGTPSGIALASIRESVFKRLGVNKKDKIIIHITDGLPADPDEVVRQVQLNKKAGIETYCLLVQGANFRYYVDAMASFNPKYRNMDVDEIFREVYGNKYQKLDDYGKLLRVLTELFGEITERK